VVQQHAAIGVELYQRTGLIEVDCGEGNAELDRRQRQATLDPAAASIETFDLLPAFLIPRRGCEFGHQFLDDVILDHHAVMGDVALRHAVEVAAPNLQRVALQVARDFIDDSLDAHDALRAPEATKRGMRHRIRLAAMRDDGDVFQKVAVVGMQHRTVVDAVRQIGRVAAVAREHEVQAADQPCVVKAHVIVDAEWVALSGQHHVIVAIESELHRAMRFRGEECRDRGGDGCLAFLAAEAAAHTACLTRHAVIGHGQRPRDEVLHFGRILRRAIDQHFAALAGDRHRDLAFEVEMILAADVQGAAQPM
jgi:hypothetical protein